MKDVKNKLFLLFIALIFLLLSITFCKLPPCTNSSGKVVRTENCFDYNERQNVRVYKEKEEKEEPRRAERKKYKIKIFDRVGNVVHEECLDYISCTDNACHWKVDGEWTLGSNMDWLGFTDDECK